MKTIKIIFTGIVLLLASIAQAQTIEETEQWLNEYGKKITLSFILDKGKNSTTFTGFDGEFLNFLNISSDSNGGSFRHSYKVSPKDILYQDVTKFSEDNFEDDEYSKGKIYQLKAKAGTIFYSGKGTSGIDQERREVKFLFENGKSEIEENIDAIRFRFSKEQSTDAIRLLKAIYHFAKLNGASDLPIVKKDTF